MKDTGVKEQSEVSLRVLLIQYSLSGETNTATHEFLRGFKQRFSSQHDLDVEVVEERIQTSPSFPFPWSFWSFFDVMPETVSSVIRTNTSLRQTRRTIEKPSPGSDDESYDLVVLGWQTWYLSPSLPIRLVVNDPDYQKLLRKAPVVVIGTHRNMWHRASRTLCRELNDQAGANVIGRINFVQSSPFLVSVVKTLRWQLAGKIEAAGATNAKDQAFAEGQKFAKRYTNGSWPEGYYESGKPFSSTLALLEDIWFPVKWSVSTLMGVFPPESLGRKVATVLYMPLISSAIVFVAPPALFAGAIWAILNKKKSE